MTKDEEIVSLKKQLAWFTAFADQIQATNHNAYNYACAEANRVTNDFPFEEGDDYWTIEELDGEFEDSQGIYENGVKAVQSCWDEVSEEMHIEDPERTYFRSLEEVLEYTRSRYNYLKIESYFDEIDDLTDGDVLVNPDYHKFSKSY